MTRRIRCPQCSGDPLFIEPDTTGGILTMVPCRVCDGAGQMVDRRAARLPWLRLGELVLIVLAAFALGYLAAPRAAADSSSLAGRPLPEASYVVGSGSSGWATGQSATARLSPSPVASRSHPSPRGSRAPDRRGWILTMGKATWYCREGVSPCHHEYPDRPGRHDAFAAAGPGLRHALGAGWRGTAVEVIVGGRSTFVWLIDWCACPGGRVIDLYADAFERLAPLPRGVIGQVIVRRLER